MSLETVISAIERLLALSNTRPATGTLQLPFPHSHEVMEAKFYLFCVLLLGCAGWLLRAFRELAVKQETHEQTVKAHLSTCSKPDRRQQEETEKRIDALELFRDKTITINRREYNRLYDGYYLDNSIPVEDIPDSDSGAKAPTRGKRNV